MCLCHRNVYDIWRKCLAKTVSDKQFCTDPTYFACNLKWLCCKFAVSSIGLNNILTASCLPVSLLCVLPCRRQVSLFFDNDWNRLKDSCTPLPRRRGCVTQRIADNLRARNIKSWSTTCRGGRRGGGGVSAYTLKQTWPFSFIGCRILKRDSVLFCKLFAEETLGFEHH